MTLNIKNKSGSGCLALFGLPFFAAGCAILWFAVISPILKVNASSDWQLTNCQIIKSELKTNHSSDSTTYTPIIHYAYMYAGQKYTADKIDFSEVGGSSDYQEENAILERFPLKSQAQCFVNPKKPSHAVLERNWGRGIFKWIAIPFGGVFACIGLGLILMGIFPFFKRKAHKQAIGPVVLKATGQRLGGIFGLLFINVFWNGIVSVFLIFWISSLVSGKANDFWLKWGLGLFLTPFVLIGLAMFWGLIKSIRKFFSPQITLTLQTLHWQQASKQSIQWHTQNQNISHFQIALICREEATYSRGTNRVTDKEEVARFTILEQDLYNQNSGSCAFDVPSGLMPTFTDNSNSILWLLEVKTGGEGIDEDSPDTYEIQLAAQGDLA